MEITISDLEDRLLESLEHLERSAPFNKMISRQRLLSQVDTLCRKPEGLRMLYKHIRRIVAAGVFDNTVYASPLHLVPALLEGTLLAGHPSSSLEILSELRLMALAEEQWRDPGLSAADAHAFLSRALVANFNLAYQDFSQPIWNDYPAGELNKVRILFDMLLEKVPLEAIKGLVCDELSTLIAHRLIVTGKIRHMLWAVDHHMELAEHDPIDNRLKKYRDALFYPTPLAARLKDEKAYGQALQDLEQAQLEEECQLLGQQMTSTGLVSVYQVTALRYVAAEHAAMVPVVLDLDSHGKADFERHESFVRLLIDQFIVPGTPQGVYGLSKVLRRNLLSRKITWNAFNRLIRIDIYPEIAANLTALGFEPWKASAIQVLVCGVLRVLGQPLGLRQGNNPTCQSARGISMWSRHAPGKLINLLIDAASANNVVMRYDGKLIESASMQEGLYRGIDPKLDPVSVVLVPHLDKIYNEMMRQAAIKHPAEDPHISVNPAFYGHWIQTGFRSVYNPLTNAIENFNAFIRIFYASFHPEYNGGHHLIYPVPLGIFLTNTRGVLLGYHAVSLLRIAQDHMGAWRAYFLNPNSEGPQNWGQGIRPSVGGYGEVAGESSLPVAEFASRVYAYHYNYLQLDDRDRMVPEDIVATVSQLARESWGKHYNWRI